MGPIRSLTGMNGDIFAIIGDVNALTDRLRSANRRLTGGTGEAPTPISKGDSYADKAEAAAPPLLVELTVRHEQLRKAVSDLRSEVIYLEGISETGQPEPATAVEKGYAEAPSTAKQWR